jgi:gamma-glutamylaminecyclotransferase
MPSIFVYGTLKRGGTNHHYLRQQTYIAEAQTVPGYTLYKPADYPGLVSAANAQEGVTGEIWEITPECLQALDALEGTAEGLYARKSIPLASPHQGVQVETYYYLPPVEGCPHLGSAWPV